MSPTLDSLAVGIILGLAGGILLRIVVFGAAEIGDLVGGYFQRRARRLEREQEQREHDALFPLGDRRMRGPGVRGPRGVIHISIPPTCLLCGERVDKDPEPHVCVNPHGMVEKLEEIQAWAEAEVAKPK